MSKKQQPIGLDELVERIISAVTDNFLVTINNVHKNGAKRDVRNLLQLETNLIVKRDEIQRFVFNVQSCHVLKPCDLCIDSIVSLFKSHGFKVEEK